jgi:L-alanine-DL-glutamate epimerase-like enolase superfamily enzyme
MANQPNINLLEFSESGSELSRDLVMPALAQVDGYITVPNSPGLGVTLNIDTVDKYLVT